MSQNASRACAAQNALGGHMRAACLRTLVYMVEKLHGHRNKHLLSINFLTGNTVGDQLHKLV